MDCKIYNPTVTTRLAINPYDNAAGLKYAANPGLDYWGGLFWAIADAQPDGYLEATGTQRIWMVTSEDGESWSDPFQPFRDSAYCNNPMSGSGQEWQPNLIAVGDELWCWWSGDYCYFSKLTDPEGKWTNYRFEWVGETPSLSTTVTGAATGGRALSPTVDGISDWLPFPSGQPTILSSGVVACPGTLMSVGHYTDQLGGGATFTRRLKYSMLLRTTDGVSWELTRVDNGLSGNYTAWEPFIVENPVGGVTLFSRKLAELGNSLDAMLVATSNDGGRSFSPLVSTKMQVPQNRGAALTVSPGRRMMAHCDFMASESGNDRRNGTLFVSPRGVNDFVPGVQWSDFDHYGKYPAFIVAQDALWLAYSSGFAGGDTAGKGRSGLRIVKVSPLPDDEHAYIHPRSRSLYTGDSDPTLVDGSPDYYDFNGFSDKIVSAASVTPSGGLSFAAWIHHDYEPPATAALIDTRSGLSGTMFRVNGLSMRSIDVLHGFTLPLETDLFVAASIDPTAMTVTQYLAYGQADFETKTSYFKTILFSGQPSNTETVTIDGTVFTFKTSASLTNDVQIGASTAATVTNLIAKVNTAMSASNAANNFITDARLIISRPDGASFTASSGAANATVETSVSLAGGQAFFGSKITGSTVPNYHGRIYDARIYDAALSTANMRSLYNARRAEFGYSTAISGTSTAPSSPLLRVDPANPDDVTFPPVGQGHRCEVVDDVLRIHGEGSAAVELPYPANAVTIRYKLSATPASTDKYVLASFGLSTSPVRLHISAANPKNLYLNSVLVATVTDPTQWNTVTVKVAANKAVVGGIDYYFDGAARCYLGNAWPESLLAATKSIDYDTTLMSVNRA